VRITEGRVGWETVLALWVRQEGLEVVFAHPAAGWALLRVRPSGNAKEGSKASRETQKPEFDHSDFR